MRFSLLGSIVGLAVLAATAQSHARGIQLKPDSDQRIVLSNSPGGAASEGELGDVQTTVTECGGKSLRIKVRNKIYLDHSVQRTTTVIAPANLNLTDARIINGLVIIGLLGAWAECFAQLGDAQAGLQDFSGVRVLIMQNNGLAVETSRTTFDEARATISLDTITSLIRDRATAQNRPSPSDPTDFDDFKRELDSYGKRNEITPPYPKYEVARESELGDSTYRLTECVRREDDTPIPGDPYTQNEKKRTVTVTAAANLDLTNRSIINGLAVRALKFAYRECYAPYFKRTLSPVFEGIRVLILQKGELVVETGRAEGGTNYSFDGPINFRGVRHVLEERLAAKVKADEEAKRAERVRLAAIASEQANAEFWSTVKTIFWGAVALIGLAIGVWWYRSEDKYGLPYGLRYFVWILPLSAENIARRRGSIDLSALADSIVNDNPGSSLGEKMRAYQYDRAAEFLARKNERINRAKEGLARTAKEHAEYEIELDELHKEELGKP